MSNQEFLYVLLIVVSLLCNVAVISKPELAKSVKGVIAAKQVESGISYGFGFDIPRLYNGYYFLILVIVPACAFTALNSQVEPAWAHLLILLVSAGRWYSSLYLIVVASLEAIAKAQKQGKAAIGISYTSERSRVRRIIFLHVPTVYLMYLLLAFLSSYQ